jgi:hypothetical protein
VIGGELATKLQREYFLAVTLGKTPQAVVRYGGAPSRLLGMMPFVHGTSIGSAGKPLDWQGATVNLASTTA